MTQNELKEARKVFFDKLEQKLEEVYKPEERLFYCHPSEDSIVLSYTALSFRIKERSEYPLPGSYANRVIF